MQPTEEQLSAIDFIVNSILNKKDVIGFVAPGGCGKTFSLNKISKDERLKGIEISFTATTNKAVVAMKGEGIPSPKTLHSAVCKHVPTFMFMQIINWYEIKNKENKISKLPNEALCFLNEQNLKPEDLEKYKNEKVFLAENKIDPYDDRIFSHYAISEHKGGAIFIDESSMLPTESQYKDDKIKVIGLDVIKEIYDTVVLVGDDSQLPPINGKSSFDGIEKVTLTKNHRSDNGLLRILSYARAGEKIINFEPKIGENIKILPYLDDSYFDREKIIENKVAHIVYKNNTRKSITVKIRRGLSQEPVIDEPIVYKGANIDNPYDKIAKNETGYFNGFVGVWENHKQSISGRNFDEYNDGFTYLQYGYAITAHTAQGSSFDYVVVHLYDIPGFIDKETKRKWIYTAVSRARKGIVIAY